MQNLYLSVTNNTICKMISNLQHNLQILKLILLKQKLKFPTYILQKIQPRGRVAGSQRSQPLLSKLCSFLDRAGPNSSRYRLLTHTVHVQSLRVFVTNSSEVTNSLPTPLILHFVFLL